MKRFGALSTLQIRYLLKKFIKKRSTFVCAIDQLKYITGDEFSIVFNNEEHYKPGMHWIGLHKVKNSNVLELFDTFNFPIDFYGEKLLKFINQQNCKIKTIPYQIQSNTSMMCGYMSIYFLVKRNQGKHNKTF